MAKISTTVEREIIVNSSLQDTFDLISNLKETPKYVPGLEKSETVDDVTFKWSFIPVGFKGINITVKYTVKYTINPPNVVSWETIPGSGNAESKGIFTLEKVDDDKTKINLKMDITVDAPIPRLLNKLAKPFLKGEAERLIDGYIANIKDELG